MIDSLEALITAERVAELLALQVSTIRAYCEQHKLPHVRIGGQLRFRPSELREWLEQRSSRPITRRRRPAPAGHEEAGTEK